MSKPPATHVHAYYQHAEEAFRELPDAIGQLERLRDAFRKADEDFLAIEIDDRQVGRSPDAAGRRAARLIMIMFAIVKPYRRDIPD